VTSDARKSLTRLSLFYPAGYLLSGGLMFLALPALAFRLFFSNQPQAYGDIVPRMAGALTFALGVLVVQVIRHRADALHKTIVGVRFFLVAVWLWLYVKGGDPFFVTLAVMVGFGIILSTVALVLDRRAGAG
jgi:hypothetical protein